MNAVPDPVMYHLNNARRELFELDHEAEVDLLPLSILVKIGNARGLLEDVKTAIDLVRSEKYRTSVRRLGRPGAGQGGDGT